MSGIVSLISNFWGYLAIGGAAIAGFFLWLGKVKRTAKADARKADAEAGHKAREEVERKHANDTEAARLERLRKEAEKRK